MQGSDGNFYGSASATNPSSAAGCNVSGQYPSGGGILFKLTPAGQFTVLHTFSGTANNGTNAPLVQGPDGNFYGVTTNDNLAGGIFRITPGGQFTELHDFGNLTATVIPSSAGLTMVNTDGASPRGLTLGNDGNFYGVTAYAGPNGNGTFFKISPSGNFTLITAFPAGQGLGHPFAGLVLGQDGNFYFPNVINVVRITPAGVVTLVKNIAGNNLYSPPEVALAPLLVAADGTLYGASMPRESGNYGQLYSLIVAPPPAPAGLQAVAGDDSVSLSWTSLGLNVTGYNVYEGSSPRNIAATPVASNVSGGSAIISGLTDDKKYYFEVAAINALGVGAPTPLVLATPQHIPAPVTGLSVSASKTAVALSWNPSAGATSYTIYASTSSGNETPVLQHVLLTRGTLTFTALNKDMITVSGKPNTYYFRVAGVNGSNTGSESAEVSITH